MELTFILDAVRRYFWFIPLFGLLFALPGLALSQSAQATWQANAVLSVVPAARDSQIDISFGGDSERYVAGQIAAMGSTALAEKVAERVGDGVDATEISNVTTFQHVTNTDIVQLVVTTESPQRSQTIANAFAETYIESLFAQINTSISPESNRLSEQLSDIRQQIADVDAEITTQMARFLDPPDVSNGGEIPPVPALEQVVPALVSEKTILLSQYSQILTALTELDLNPQLRVASEVLQPAPLPLAPILPRTKLLTAAGLIGGLFLGVLAAVVAARLSPRLLSIHHASEVVGEEVVATIPWARLPKHDFKRLLRGPPTSLEPAVQAISVLAEASSRRHTSLTIVVAGVQRGSGSTTLSLALTNRFVAQGLSVILADLDTSDPQITREFAPNGPEVATYLQQTLRDDLIDTRELAAMLTPTGTPGLSILGLGASGAPLTIRRSQADELVRATSSGVDVVVFDVGSLLDASSSVNLAQAADVVILAIPERAHTATLRAVVQPLRARDGHLLPILTPTSRRLRHFFRRPSPHVKPDRSTGSKRFPVGPSQGWQSTVPAPDQGLEADENRSTTAITR